MALGCIVKLGKTNPIGRKGIQVRGIDLTSITAQVRKTQIISHNQDNIGLVGLLQMVVTKNLRNPEEQGQKE